ncbi:MAG: molybdenum ABC transporter ATP-binding protein [Alphaproteobacteria bacterium]|nr:molybdenum ABC transporter ATP-binding protein [Alphaproteobacteria bacterium]
MAADLRQPAVEAWFRLRRGDFVLDSTIALPAAGIVGLFGPSGAGKSTLLRCLAGVERAPEGRVSVNGTIWQGDGVFVPPHRRSVGLVFQDAVLFPHMSVRTNLRFGARRLRAGRRRVPEGDVVDLLGLERLLERKPATLSGGEVQRVAIGRALLNEPDLLLLDEPLASLDVARREEILPYLDRLHAELAMPTIFVSHNVEEMRRLADSVAIMAAGRILSHRPTADALAGLGPDADQGSIASLDARFVGSGRVALRGGEAFDVAGSSGPVGGPCRVRIAARDVSLALDRPSRASALAVWPATVEAIARTDCGVVEVSLRCDGGLVHAQIAGSVAAALGLAMQSRVFALIHRATLAAPGDATNRATQRAPTP